MYVSLLDLFKFVGSDAALSNIKLELPRILFSGRTAVENYFLIISNHENKQFLEIYFQRNLILEIAFTIVTWDNLLFNFISVNSGCANFGGLSPVELDRLVSQTAQAE